MQGGQAIDNIIIPPGSSHVWQTTGTGPFSQGYAEVFTSSPVSGFAIFRQRVPGRFDQEAAVPVNAGSPSRFLLPFDNAGLTTTMAIANASDTAASTVNVVIRGSQQEILFGGNLTLPTRGQDAFSITDRFPVTAGRRGIIEFTVLSGEISAIGLRFANEAFTSYKTQIY
jgi:PPE-repeat protein